MVKGLKNTYVAGIVCILVGKKKKLISSEKILSYYNGDNNRELYKNFLENVIKAKVNIEEQAN